LASDVFAADSGAQRDGWALTRSKVLIAVNILERMTVLHTGFLIWKYPRIVIPEASFSGWSTSG